MISSARSSFITAFAEELRRAREYNGVLLKDVEAETHISAEFLAALESGQWEIIPQPYLRGYLHLYAQSVGMNVDKVLQGFDRIVSTPEEEDSATLDSSSPLLRQPEYIGVTRAKIRTEWFTALTQNRKSAYIALVAVIALLGTGLYLFRRAQRPPLSVVPFEQTASEYRQTLRGPMTHVSLFASDSTAHMSKRDTHRASLIGLDFGTAVIAKSDKNNRIIRYRPYDTLVIYYDTLAYIEVTPSQSALVSGAGKDTLTPNSVLTDSAYYFFAGERGDSLSQFQDPSKAP